MAQVVSGRIRTRGMYRFGSRNKRVLQGITKIVSSYRSEGKDPREYVQNLIFMSHSKTCLVTGASKGIGHGVAQSLLDHAPPLSTIYLTSRTPPKIIHMNSTSSTLIYHPLDITTPFSIDALYKTIKEAGRTDVLVNNLGNATGSVEEIVECNYYERYRADVKAGVSKEKGWPTRTQSRRLL
ncbi:uncharacterized protein LAJ45_03277 [Morchella importuna]|uniref:uncharacterized protein n=1 Tax=Morchella importuna TaxID=1174673 RepID=UPI001E8E21DB|nr:uncharacterized protein LAJ45_03277 [Morchella importuna]KAH8152437.1 hypothetical protein LAJ45_03277 [Morchella importuna]